VSRVCRGAAVRRPDFTANYSTGVQVTKALRMEWRKTDLERTIPGLGGNGSRNHSHEMTQIRGNVGESDGECSKSRAIGPVKIQDPGLIR
jgi:hypothetical protein